VLLACGFLAVVIFDVVDYFFIRLNIVISFLLLSDCLQGLKYLISSLFQQIKITVILFALLFHHRTLYMAFDLLLTHIVCSLIATNDRLSEFRVTDSGEPMMYLHTAFHLHVRLL